MILTFHVPPLGAMLYRWSIVRSITEKFQNTVKLDR